MARRTIFSNTGEYLYVKNPKCGSSTVSHMVYQWQHGRRYSGNIHLCPDLVRGKNCSFDVLNGLLNDDAFKFSFVRDPVKRVESAFKNFFLDFNNTEHRSHLRYLKNFGFSPDLSNEAKFDTFLDYIAYGVSENPRRFDPHFRPQFFNLRPDLIKYDFIGHVETLDQDLQSLSKKLARHPVENRRGPENRINRSRSEFACTPSQSTRIRDLFDVDYTWFDF